MMMMARSISVSLLCRQLYEIIFALTVNGLDQKWQLRVAKDWGQN